MNFKPAPAGIVADVPLRRDTHNPKYRPDIDGLRAIAVLSVLFFHVGFNRFSGGWVGVDVFFVVSGFLITRLIKDEVEEGSFSFANFYARRARRLFASFVFTVAVTFIAGSLIFDRGYLQHFAGEVVYALVAASNFFYWLDGGYFGVAEQYKPLLHTWSLGVEEQFYLIWPLTMVVMLRHFPRRLGLVLTLASLLSLLGAEYFYYLDKQRAVFFLLPSRIFEFAIGAMMVWLCRHHASEPMLGGALLLGLALIFVAIFGFTKDTPFPTTYALVPCLGTALVIFGGRCRNLRWLLGNSLLVGIGKISYSLYLIHWPAIVFYSYHRLAPLDHLQQAVICIGSVFAAALMYAFIEQPFRDPRRVRFSSRASLGLTCVSAVTILLVPASIVWAKGTLYWRGSVEQISAARFQQIEEQHKQDEVDDLLRDRPFASSSGGRTRLMFVGDSHSGDAIAGLFLTLGTERYDYARSGFGPRCFSSVDRRPWILRLGGAESECEGKAAALRRSPSVAEADYLFIANRWTRETLKGFGEGLALLRALTRARIILVGQNPTFLTFDDSLRFLSPAQLPRLNNVLYQQRSLADIQINEQLRQLAVTNGLDFLDLQPLVCPPGTSQCEVLAPDGRFLYRDNNHWTYAGRTVFGRRMAERLGDLVKADSGRRSTAQR